MKPVETMMGYTTVSYLEKKFNIATDTVNEIIVMYPDFSPA